MKNKYNLPPEQAAQWTDEVIHQYSRLRKARSDWLRENAVPSDVLSCHKDDGMLTPLFEPNEPYLNYQKIQQEWVLTYEPEYIKQNRARMSGGDFGEEDDWQ